VFHSNDFHTMKLLRYVEPLDYFVLACEYVYVLFIAYYVAEEFIEIRQNGLSYLASLWSALDVAVIAVSILNISLVAILNNKVNNDVGTLLGSPDTYADFKTLSLWSKVMETGLALCLFLSWVKLLKYITFNRTMVQLTKTLTKVWIEFNSHQREICFRPPRICSLLAFCSAWPSWPLPSSATSSS